MHNGSDKDLHAVSVISGISVKIKKGTLRNLKAIELASRVLA